MQMKGLSYFLVFIFVIVGTITAIAQEITIKYEIYALKYATVKTRDPLTWVAQNAPKDTLFDPAFMFWLIKGDNGKNILVDSGFINDDDSFQERYNLKTYTQPDSLLARIDLLPDEITDIVITHPHRDHIDGIDLFPKAEIWMQKEDYNYFVGPAWDEESPTHGYLRRDVVKLEAARANGRLNLVDGEKEIFPSIKVYTGSRHTFNSQYVVVHDASNTVVLASDNANTYFNIVNNDPVPEHATLDQDGYVRALKRMRTMVNDTDFIIPGHDNAVFNKFDEVAKDIVRIK